MRRRAVGRDQTELARYWEWFGKAISPLVGGYIFAGDKSGYSDHAVLCIDVER